MKAILTYKSLIKDFIIFLLFGGIVWSITIVGQNNFSGNNLFPLLIRSAILLSLLILAYYVNYRLTRKNLLNDDILKFKSESIKQYLSGIILGCIVITTIWIIVYLFYPFSIARNINSTIRPVTDIVSYSLDNTLEELLFRGFLLLASVKFFGKIGGALFISLLFGLFHLQGLGLTIKGLSMVMTTFTMSLLFISTIYYTKSIWPAVTFHITGNLLLHTLGFDGGNNGMFQLKFVASNINGHFITLIYETVVIIFALLIYLGVKKQI